MVIQASIPSMKLGTGSHSLNVLMQVILQQYGVTHSEKLLFTSYSTLFVKHAVNTTL